MLAPDAKDRFLPLETAMRERERERERERDHTLAAACADSGCPSFALFFKSFSASSHRPRRSSPCGIPFTPCTFHPLFSIPDLGRRSLLHPLFPLDSSCIALFAAACTTACAVSVILPHFLTPFPLTDQTSTIPAPETKHTGRPRMGPVSFIRIYCPGVLRHF